MPVLYANNAASRLAASITNVATSFSVTAGHGARFPAITGGDHFYATLMDSAGNLEIVRVTARSVDTFTVQRAQEGTTARAYSVNDIVELRLTRGTLDDFKTDTRTGYLPLGGGIMTGAITFAAGQTWPTFNQNTTGSAGSVAWTNVSGRPTAVSSFTNDSAYITTAGARSALSFTAGSGAYNSTTGVITIPTNTNQLTNGAGFTGNTGTVTSVGGTGTVSGLTLTGTVTGSGNLTLGGTLSLTSGNVTTALGFTPYNATNPSGYITSSGTAANVSGVVGVGNGGTGGTTAAAARANLGAFPTAGGTFVGEVVGISSGSTTLGAFAAQTTGGGFSAMWSRYGAFRTFVNHTGSSYSPSFSTYYEYTGGYAGHYSIGHLTTNAANPGNLVIHHINSAAGAQNFWFFDGVNGNFTAGGSVTQFSDERMKSDWGDIPTDFIERLALVKSGTYTNLRSGERQAGASAQGMQALLPEVVSCNNHEQMLTLAYGNAALVSAVELAKRLLKLEEEIAILRNVVHGPS
jgi:hypothetical protein